MEIKCFGPNSIKTGFIYNSLLGEVRGVCVYAAVKTPITISDLASSKIPTVTLNQVQILNSESHHLAAPISVLHMYTNANFTSKMKTLTIEQ